MLNIEPREYQKAIFETAKDKNTLVVLPTGIGKTLISLMLAVERLKKCPLSKVLMLAPTRPLVEQHYQTFKKHLPELFADIQLFTGQVTAKKRKQIFQTADIIFSTPQCIANDIEKARYNLNDVSLLVIDEAHRCLKNYDYTKVVSAYKNQATSQRILGLTASPGSESERIKQICKHLNIEAVESRTRESEDVKPYLQELEFNKIEIPFPQEFIEIRTLLKKLYDDKVEKLRSRSLLFGPANKITLLQLQTRLAARASQRDGNSMAGMSICAQAIKLSHAIELLETQTLSGFNNYLQTLVKQANEKKSRGVQTLVKSPEFSAALISLSYLLAKKQEHPKIQTLVNITKEELQNNENSKLLIFTQFRDTAQTILSNLKEISQVKASIFVGQAKKKSSQGQTGLNQKEQREVLEKFKAGKLNCLISTSVGEEGLDIVEVSCVIFYEPIPSAIRSIQRKGRTARHSPGKLIIMITKNTRDEAFHYAALAKERRMHKAISKIQEEINNKPKTLKDFA